MNRQPASAGRYKGILLIFLVFGPAFLLIFISTRGCQHKFKQLEDFGPMPAYSFTDASGKAYTNRSFRNKIVLFTTIQESCPGDCGIAFWHFDQTIYQLLRTNKKKLGHVKIVTFVTDGKGNPVEDLTNARYILKDRVTGYDSSIWILAKGDARKAFDVTHNGENLLKKGDTYYGGEAFQELMLLSDKKGRLRMVLKGNSEGMIRRMKEDIALLDKQYDLEAYNQRKKK